MYWRAFVTMAAMAVVSSGAIGQAREDWDVWIVPIIQRDGAPVLGRARDLTKRAGYDNQPVWAPAGGLIYYSSKRDDAQNDIWSVEVATGTVARVTVSAPESEYSPTIIPGANALSVVRVERDSAQRLWRVPLDGGPMSVILPGSDSVGYHAWANEHTIAMFVLGRPATLRIGDVRTGGERTIAADIRRGLAKIPDANAVSFVRRVSATESWIMRLDIATGDTSRIAPALPNSEDYAWMPNGWLIMAQGTQVFAWNKSTWTMIADLAPDGVRDITRLAVSPRGDFLALVARDQSR